MHKICCIQLHHITCLFAKSIIISSNAHKPNARNSIFPNGCSHIGARKTLLLYNRNDYSHLSTVTIHSYLNSYLMFIRLRYDDDFIIRNFRDTIRERKNTYFRIQTTKNIYVEMVVISQNHVPLCMCVSYI